MDKNNLDGLTILRFASAFRRGAGVEEHLNGLDHILLTRNKVKVIRMYLEKELKGEKKITEKIGQGNLVEIPLALSVGATQSHSNKQKIWQSKLSFFKKMFREWVVYNPLLYRVFFRDFLKRYYPRPQAFQARYAGGVAKKIFQEYNVDLLVMHDLGGVDSAEIIEEAKKRRIPYIFINHFSNDRFTNISVREQLNDAAGIAGISGVGIPKRIKDRFHNVSNGIDMKIFNPVRARSLGIETNIPIIIYPARITRVKGQIDLIKAYAKLKREGIRAKVIFAGRLDSVEYEAELKELTKMKGLTNDVLFVGQLNTEELRDWYGISSVMAFPTYHQEGLGRITVEAQAMKVPPVAYIIGGTPEGILHGKTGFLVRKGDLHTFTERIKELLTDEKKRKTMGEEGRRFVQDNFSLEALADRHEKYYLRVLRNARNRASY